VLQVYWVDVDYLQLAAAAAQCGAHFTALLYIEAWQEEQHGWLAPLDTAAASAAAAAAEVAAGSSASASAIGGGSTAERQVEAVERLLLDTYSQINEPDGIYAVARSHSMLSQVCAPLASALSMALCAGQCLLSAVCGAVHGLTACCAFVSNADPNPVASRSVLPVAEAV
jgi:hypothetical protein